MLGHRGVVELVAEIPVSELEEHLRQRVGYEVVWRPLKARREAVDEPAEGAGQRLGKVALQGAPHTVTTCPSATGKSPPGSCVTAPGIPAAANSSTTSAGVRQ